MRSFQILDKKFTITGVKRFFAKQHFKLRNQVILHIFMIQLPSLGLCHIYENNFPCVELKLFVQFSFLWYDVDPGQFCTAPT